jgi:hypothetical protein
VPGLVLGGAIKHCSGKSVSEKNFDFSLQESIAQRISSSKPKFARIPIFFIREHCSGDAGKKRVKGESFIVIASSIARTFF